MASSPLTSSTPYPLQNLSPSLLQEPSAMPAEAPHPRKHPPAREPPSPHPQRPLAQIRPRHHRLPRKRPHGGRPLAGDGGGSPESPRLRLLHAPQAVHHQELLLRRARPRLHPVGGLLQRRPQALRPRAFLRQTSQLVPEHKRGGAEPTRGLALRLGRVWISGGSDG